MNPHGSPRPTLHVAVVVNVAPTTGLISRLEATAGINVQMMSAAECRAHLASLRADVVVVDGGIAKCLELMRDIRSAQPSLPMLFIAHEMAEVVAATFVGANDFAVASASGAELVARIQLLASPSFRPHPRMRRIGALRLDQDTRALSYGTQSVLLSPIELKVFERLVLQAGRPLSKTDLERSIWPPEDLVDRPTNIAVVYISYLRRKLARLGEVCWITTTTNVGYTLEWRSSPERSAPRPRT